MSSQTNLVQKSFFSFKNSFLSGILFGIVFLNAFILLSTVRLLDVFYIIALFILFWLLLFFIFELWMRPIYFHRKGIVIVDGLSEKGSNMFWVWSFICSKNVQTKMKWIDFFFGLSTFVICCTSLRLAVLWFFLFESVKPLHSSSDEAFDTELSTSAMSDFSKTDCK